MSPHNMKDQGFNFLVREGLSGLKKKKMEQQPSAWDDHTVDIYSNKLGKEPRVYKTSETKC